MLCFRHHLKQEDDDELLSWKISFWQLVKCLFWKLSQELWHWHARSEVSNLHKTWFCRQMQTFCIDQGLLEKKKESLSSISTSIASAFPINKVHSNRCWFFTTGRIFSVEKRNKPSHLAECIHEGNFCREMSSWHCFFTRGSPSKNLSAIDDRSRKKCNTKGYLKNKERERWQRTWAACREREIHEGSEGSGMKTCMFLIGRCAWFDKNFKVYEPQWHEPKRQSRHQARKQHQSDYHHNIYVESWRSRRLVSHLLLLLPLSTVVAFRL